MFALAGVLAGLNLLAKAVRWRLMLRFQTGISVSLRLALSSIVSGVAASSLTPGRALDLGKPLRFSQAYGGPAGKALAATVGRRKPWTCSSWWLFWPGRLTPWKVGLTGWRESLRPFWLCPQPPSAAKWPEPGRCSGRWGWTSALRRPA